MYRVREIEGVDPAGPSVAQALSRDGVVAGLAGWQCFVEGCRLELPDQPVHLHALSSDGRYAGGARQELSGWRALLYDLAEGSWRDLGDGVRVLGVNNSGQAVGVAAGPDCHTRGFFWDQELRLVDSSRRLTAVNDRGQAVGFDLENRALFLEPGNEPELLPGLEGFDESLAFGLDAGGDRVVGACGRGASWFATLWTREPEWSVRRLTREGGAALDVNRAGQVVGTAFSRPPLGYDPLTPWAFTAGGQVRAALWQGEEVLLPELKVAVAINDAGHIAGWGVHPANPRQKRALCLEPAEAAPEFELRPGRPQELSSLLELLPQLADFELPPRRRPEHLWQGDAKLLEAWASGHKRALVEVAEGPGGALYGLSVVTLRDELLSGAPSAHLEVLVVAQEARRRGVGRALLARAEERSRNSGALSLTLHVFERNRRARALYEGAGFEVELLRCIKDLA